ncbi:MAG TPA: hypothetical protein VGB19_10280 [Actinomycetota bacterium]
MLARLPRIDPHWMSLRAPFVANTNTAPPRVATATSTRPSPSMSPAAADASTQWPSRQGVVERDPAPPEAGRAEERRIGLTRHHLGLTVPVEVAHGEVSHGGPGVVERSVGGPHVVEVLAVEAVCGRHLLSRAVQEVEPRGDARDHDLPRPVAVHVHQDRALGNPLSHHRDHVPARVDS